MNASKRTASSPVSSDFQGFHASTPRVETLVEWVDDKGYTWVELNGKRHFLHIKNFKSRPRHPRAGESIHFIGGIPYRARKAQGNFLIYAYRASKKLDAPEIKQQVRNHWKKLQEEIRKPIRGQLNGPQVKFEKCSSPD